MIPPDYANHLYALTNNVKQINFNSSLDPIITPKTPVRINATIESYLRLHEKSISKSNYKTICMYYILKMKLKSIEDIMAEFNDFKQDETDLYIFEINEFVCNGKLGDLFLAPYLMSEFVGDKKERFMEEAKNVAMENGNFAACEFLDKLEDNEFDC